MDDKQLEILLKEWRKNPKGRPPQILRNYMRKKNIVRDGSTSRFTKYDMTKDDYLILLVSQNNKCAICKKRFKKDEKTHIDHDHKTGKVRGILHQLCNTGLGCFRDNPESLRGAIEYLSKPPAQIINAAPIEVHDTTGVFDAIV